MWENNSPYNYEDVFDGFVFYKPVEEHNLVSGFDGLIPKDSEDEFFRRLIINLKYNENNSLLKEIENKDFRIKVLKELNSKRELKYPSIETLIETRDKYLND